MDCGQVVEDGLELVFVDPLTFEDQLVHVMEHVSPQVHHLLLCRPRAIWRQQQQHLSHSINSTHKSLTYMCLILAALQLRPTSQPTWIKTETLAGAVLFARAIG